VAAESSSKLRLYGLKLRRFRWGNPQGYGAWVGVQVQDDHRLDEILRELRRLLEYGAERVEVRFNAMFWYVEYLSLTPGGGVPDQDWYVEMQRFVQR
jgi:hypothetical protein